MKMVEQKRLVLTRLLEAKREVLPRPARQFLEKLLKDEALLERMGFCRSEERARLRNSVLIATEDACCWSVLLDNQPDAGRAGAQQRSRLALEGLDLSPDEVLERLRGLPIWFLAVDPVFASPPGGEAVRLENTLYRMVRMRAARLRRIALLDQIDAALDEGNRNAFKRLARLLAG